MVGLVMPLTDGFGGFGAIAKFNKTSTHRIVYRLLSHPIQGPIPESAA
jgi:hypothetical protein